MFSFFYRLITIFFQYFVPVFLIAWLIYGIYRKTYYQYCRRRKVRSKWKSNTLERCDGRETRVVIDENEHDEVAFVLSRALFHDPIHIFTLPNEACRMKFPIMACVWMINHCSDFVLATSDTEGSARGIIRSAAIWKSSKTKDGFLYILKMMIYFNFYSTPFYTQRYWKTLLAHLAMEKIQEEVMKDQKEKGYYYLAWLGTDPTSHGKGYGSHNISQFLRLADKEQRHCYLESTNERNHSFYKRHGFKVVRESIFGNKVRTYHMRREPL